MSTTTLPVRAVRKARTDGLRATVKQGTYEVWQTIAPHLATPLLDRLDVRHRPELRDSATLRAPTATDHLPYKGHAGAPNRTPQAFYRPGERFVTVVEDAQVIGRRGLPMADGAVIADCVAPPIILPRRPSLAVQAALRDLGPRRMWGIVTGDETPAQYLDRAAHVLPPFHNYYHWTINLAKLRLLEHHGDATGAYPPLLVPADRPGWMDETLDLISYPGDLVDWGAQAATVGELVVPTYPDPVVEELGWLRDRLRAGAGATGGGGRRLLVTREDATRRQLANREAVREALTPLGFEAICPGEYSVAEQVRLFSAADIIVGPHGAGLTNLIYASDATVIELWATKQTASFSRMSHELGHTHIRQEHSTRTGNLVVDTDRLVTEVEYHV